MIPFSGWKRTAVYLTGLIATLTTLLIVLLFVSLFSLKKDDLENSTGSNAQDALGQSILYRGSCTTSAKANLWIHLAINIIGTGVLASSNFFMQSLVAPTRAEVDAAHRSGHWLEIGVQSLKNFRFLGWRKILFWSLFCLSSVPLHLVFNGTVLESKGTNGSTIILGAEDLIKGGWHENASISGTLYESAQYPNTVNPQTLKSISDSMTDGNWQTLPFYRCMSLYNDPDISLTQYRHAIFVMYDYDDFDRNSTQGWKRGDVLKNTTDSSSLNVTNPLWGVSTVSRTGRSSGLARPLSNPGIQPLGDYGNGSRWIAGVWDMQGTKNVLDPVSGVVIMDPLYFTAKHRVMQVDHCLSERFEAPCRLSVANSLLLIVCVMCTMKCVLCFLVLKLRVWGDENPLMTPGDAIASFIARPDEETKGMCTLSLEDMKENPNKRPPGIGNISHDRRWLQSPRQWHAASPRRFGKAVPMGIWVISFLLIGSSLTVAAVMLYIAIRGQPLGDSRFGHSPQNEDVANETLEKMQLTPLTMVANTPQLVLSICYLAYNGLFTRMLAEFEWSKYSVQFRALRVTEPKGKQNSTYRLQLPYRFSIPLIIVSTLLHWIYSNSYSPSYPYTRDVTVGLQFSSKAILIGFLVTICVATVPLLLAWVKLPGVMVIAGGNSAVISAACHYPTAKLQSLSRATSRISRPDSEYDSASARLIGDQEVEELEGAARKKVKWGRMSTGKSDESQVGHLGFGTEEFDIEIPVEGEHYSGL
ncbi:hypothetical protein FGRMN_11105 [Fusarium graminum]|nr:hypothetical protein FGRMN_11105 [Fusarium graminum]